MFSKNIFSERISILRQQSNITQSQLARSIGISKQAINDIEHERRAASIEVMCAIADYFDTSLDYLTGRNDNPNSHKQ